MKRYQMLIGGEWVDAEARETFETENPYLGAAWAFVPRAKSGGRRPRGGSRAEGVPRAVVGQDQRDRARARFSASSPI